MSLEERRSCHQLACSGPCDGDEDQAGGQRRGAFLWRGDEDREERLAFAWCSRPSSDDDEDREGCHEEGAVRKQVGARRVRGGKSSLSLGAFLLQVQFYANIVFHASETGITSRLFRQKMGMLAFVAVWRGLREPFLVSG